MMETLYKLIRHFEQLRLRAYLCPAGVPTNGYGSTGRDVYIGMPDWTVEQAETRMERDAGVHWLAALKYCPVLMGDQVAAIADFSYNVGATRLKASTLRRKINARQWPAARRELLKWVHGGGRVLPGLVIRRHAEAAML